MYTFVGSTAMKFHYPDFREPKDIDLLMSDDKHDIVRLLKESNPDAKVDAFIDERLAQWDWNYFATPDEMLTLKISHSFWEINRSSQNWDKHASDIRFLQRNGAQFIRELYDILLPIWKERYGKKQVNLNKKANDFFADAVNRKYDHDSVHESVAYTPGHALYKNILKEGSDVLVDNDKFWALDLDEQLQLRTVREEIYATALERILIPKDYKSSPRGAYWWALRRTATSLFKGEWALFLMLHLDELAVPDMDYMQQHLDNQDQLILLENNG